MKRFFGILLAIAVTCLCLGQNFVQANAANSGTCGDNLKWKLEGDTLTISGTGKMDDYYYHDGYKMVVAPWDDDHSPVRNIIVEEGVTYLGKGAFSCCVWATNVSLPNSLQEIGDRVFQHLDIESIVIPDNVSSIGDMAFYECHSLKDITFGSKLQSIGDTAFGNCESIVSVSIPASVTNIGTGAFGNCDGLTGIWVDSANKNFKSDSFGVLYNKEMTELLQMPGGFSGVYSVPDGVKTIGPGACSDMEGLTEIIIPDGVTEIKTGAFFSCDNLVKMRVPNSLESLGHQALYGLNNVEYAVVDSVKYLGNEKNPCVVAMGPASDTIGDCEIQSGTKIIFDSAFQNCSGLTTVVIPDSVVAMGERAFEWCADLTKVTIGSGLREIPFSGFNGCSALETVTISGNVTAIGEWAFADCSSLENIVLPSSLTKIEARAFVSCTSLKEVVIPRGVTEINDGFAGCTGLTRVVLHENVTKIGYEAFMGCKALTEVIFCGTAEQWETMDKTDVFGDLAPTYHFWQDASCTQVPTCQYCEAKGEEMLPHTPGEEATETTGQYCTVCGQELAPALGVPETQPSEVDTQPSESVTQPSEEEGQPENDTTTAPAADGENNENEKQEEPENNNVVWIAAGSVTAVGVVGAGVWFLRRKKFF